jgi:hypothetical protein
VLAVLAIIAAGLALALGWLFDDAVLVAIALVVSLAGLVPLAAGPARAWWARHRPKAPAASGDEDSGASTGAGVAEQETPQDEATSQQPQDASPDPRAESATRSGEPTPRRSDHTLNSDSPVHVIPGRTRFHSRDCDLLTGRGAEVITLLEAREESFTPCTACLQAP